MKLNTLTEVELFFTHRLETYYHLLKTRLEACDPIVKINRYIQSSYADESLSINKISEHIHLSPSHMCFLFKDKTGKTLNQFLTEFRMEKARELLCKKEYKVSDIAVKVGYSDSNYFTKIFRKWMGLTPTEYRGRYLR